jgi:hypothetical protein
MSDWNHCGPPATHYLLSAFTPLQFTQVLEAIVQDGEVLDKHQSQQHLLLMNHITEAAADGSCSKVGGLPTTAAVSSAASPGSNELRELCCCAITTNTDQPDYTEGWPPPILSRVQSKLEAVRYLLRKLGQ